MGPTDDFRESGPGRPGDFGARFLRRTTWAVMVTGGVLAIAVAYRWGGAPGLGFAVGLGWGLANFWALAYLMRAFVRREGPDKRRVVQIGAVKMAVYGAGIALLVTGWLPLIALTAGFTWLLTVVFLRALGAWWIGRYETPGSGID